MKYIFPILIAFVLIMPAHAAINPDIILCERYDMYMEILTDENGEEVWSCVNETTSCPIDEVNNGSCNGVALEPLRCRVQGEEVETSIESCCEGFSPYWDESNGQSICFDPMRKTGGSSIHPWMYRLFVVILVAASSSLAYWIFGKLKK